MMQTSLPFRGALRARRATRTTDEAMTTLSSAHRARIAQAREIARELVQRDGDTDTRRVRAAMATRGLLDPDAPEYWLGAVFRGDEWRWTGEWRMPSAAELSAVSHASRPVRVWTLAS